MLNIYIPKELQNDFRILRVPSAFCFDMKGEIPADAKKVVWATGDRTAYDLNAVNYMEYDWSDVDVLCFGGDDEILIDMDVIKPEHDVVTIPNLSASLYVDQAMAIILNYYIRKYPCPEREARAIKKAALYRTRWQNGTWVDKRQLK